MQPGRVGRTGRIHIVLELPVVPAHQVFVEIFNHTGYLSSALHCIGNTAKLCAHSSVSQFMNFLLSVSNVEVVEYITFSCTQLFVERTVCMEIEHVF